MVLSGCETAMTDFADVADEHLGIASGFLFAGSAAILSTQWAVTEGAAALLTAAYYARLQKAGPAAALRAAQHHVRQAGRNDLRRLTGHARRVDFRHPVFWATYTVTALPALASAGRSLRSTNG